MQAKFTVIEDAAQTRALSKEEQSLLASKEKVLTQAEVNAKLGDQIAAQERLNKLLDNSLKYTTQMREKTAALTDSNGLGSKEAQRNLERAQLRQGWKNQGGNLSDKGYQDEISALESYYSAQDKLRSDWQSGAMTGLANFADEASDLNQLTANAVSGIMNSATSSISSNLTSVLTGATSFKDGLSDIFSSIGQTVIQTLIQMATQALITKAILSSVGGASGGGLFGSLFSGLSFNAKGGVYDSPSLSAYSNGVYSSPQLFAFAKGAGIFAEAGPEAIMPLARTAGVLLVFGQLGHLGKYSQPSTVLEKGQMLLAVIINLNLSTILTQNLMMRCWLLLISGRESLKSVL